MAKPSRCESSGATARISHFRLAVFYGSGKYHEISVMNCKHKGSSCSSFVGILMLIVRSALTSPLLVQGFMAGETFGIVGVTLARKSYVYVLLMVRGCYIWGSCT